MPLFDCAPALDAMTKSHDLRREPAIDDTRSTPCPRLLARLDGQIPAPACCLALGGLRRSRSADRSHTSPNAGSGSRASRVSS